MKMRILIIEDEKYIARSITEVLKMDSYTVDLAHDGEYGLDCALTEIYDVIVLDIMLPKMDGLRVLEKIRGANISTPVILLTAKGDLEDKVKGLDLGADDYLSKPFYTEELLARIRALTRRKPELRQGGVFAFEDIELSALALRSGERTAKMQRKEAQILELLIDNGGFVVSKEMIIEKVWGFDAETEYSLVEKNISIIRKKLSQVKARVNIKTVRGVGYMLTMGGGNDVQ
jgi:DNA-binding response OmpR family regulator